MLRLPSVSALVLILAAVACGQQPLTFESADGLTITADFYGDKSDLERPLICLFHQANWSRGEYREIAPKLVALGFNCLAADARSGNEINGVQNETARRATQRGEQVGFDFIQAYPDIVATLKYAKHNLARGQLIAWGSSYSAALVLKASADHPGLVAGTLSFAPSTRGEWTRDWLVPSAAKLNHPVFITSAKDEQANWQRIYEAVPEAMRFSYLPATKGNHGSRALWAEFPDNGGYWNAVIDFLRTHFLQPAAN